MLSKASLFLTCADKLLIPSTKVSIGFLVLPNNLSIIFLSIPVTSSKLVVTVSIKDLSAVAKSSATDALKNLGKLPNLTVPGLTADAVIKPLSCVELSHVSLTNLSNTSSPICPGALPTLYPFCLATLL